MYGCDVAFRDVRNIHENSICDCGVDRHHRDASAGAIHWPEQPYGGYGYWLKSEQPLRQPLHHIQRQLTALTKPQRDAWVTCSLNAASKYFSADENASTIARAAMTACHSEERAFENALVAYNRTRIIPTDMVAYLRNSFVEKLTQIIIERRQDIKVAQATWKEWADCVIDAAGEIVKREMPLKEAVLQSYRVCGVEEDAVRRTLANLTSDAAAEVDCRKIRVAPIVAKWVEEVRSARGDRPKPPDITI
jgi:hypothetical protein